MSETAPGNELLRLAAQIVAGHLAHNKVSADYIPEMIGSVHALNKAGSPAPEAAQLEPAVPIKKSVLPG